MTSQTTLSLEQLSAAPAARPESCDPAVCAVSCCQMPGGLPKPETRPFLLTPRGELASAMVAGGLLLGGWVIALASPGAVGGLLLARRALIWAALAIGLFHGGRSAVSAVRSATFDIDVLMIVGAVLAAWLGAPSEGALLLFLFTLAGALEDLAVQRTTRAVEALTKLMPAAAVRLEPGSGRWVSVPPESLMAGDRVRIAPGEQVPADARLVLGSTTIDQAAITGESMPRAVDAGDELYAGTINVGNPVEAVVTRPAAQSSLQKILNLVVAAQRQREPVQRLIDRFSQPYAIGVFAASIGVYLLWHFALGVTGKESVYTAITLLIVASPCALIISTPTATLAAISRAARGGVLFKGGQAIERLSRIGAIAFDKTGTLTLGRPRLLAIVPVHGVATGDAEAVAEAEADILAAAAALEEVSTHPVATAIVEAAKNRGVRVPAATDRAAVTGRGVSATVGGAAGRLGSLAYVADVLPRGAAEPVRAALEQARTLGRIGVVCVVGSRAAVLVLADAPRAGAETLAPALHALGVRPVVMLTGDHRATAASVAEALGLDGFHAELLPQDKLEQVARLKRIGDQAHRPRVVGVIGDGVNDAPALAAADVSMAIGSIGADAALESADIVLLADDLRAVPWAIALARRARATIALNLAFSLGAITIMAAATLIGQRLGTPLPLWLGVIGHEGGTLLVVINSLVLLRYGGVRKD